jgi:hypothetical protein
MTIRDPRKHRLWLSVDSLMDLRNNLGAAEADPGFLELLDHIIVTAQRADVYGRGIG